MKFKLNDKQRQAVQYNDGPLLIIAGAGTGKTAVITQRIIHIINENWAKPSEILALTFTEKASAEMEERVDQSMPIGYEEPWISTFHSFCDRVLRQEGSYIGLDTNYTLMSSAQSYILFRKHLFEFSLDNFRPLGNPTSSIGAMLTHFSRLQDEATTPDDYIKFAESLEIKDKKIAGKIAKFTKEEYKELAQVYKEYTDLKIKESRLDFGDLIIHTLNLFKQKPNILEKYREQFKYILVDEYQDTNYTQNVLVNMLALGSDPDKATKTARKKANLTVVGDDDQSIYKFRGAAISNILQFKETYPEAEKVVLIENYRSRQEILDASYHLISYNNPNRLEITEKIDKKLVSRIKQSKTNDAVQLMVGERGADEASLVAREILKLTGHKDMLKNDSSLVDRKFDYQGQSMFMDVIDEKGEFKFSDISILVRANAHADEFIQVMKYYGIPFKFAGPKGLYSRPEISIFISFLKTVVDKTDGISMFNVLKMSEWGLSAREIVNIMQDIRKSKSSVLDWLEMQFGTKLGDDANSYEIASLEEDQEHLLLNKASNLFAKVFSEEAQYGLANLFVSYDIAYKMVKEGKSVGEVLLEFFKNSGNMDHLLAEETMENQFRIQNISKFFELIKKYEGDNADSNIFDYVDFLQYSIDIGENPKVDQDLLEDYDAVTISTIHSSKGLEYPVVFLVNLVKGRFPSQNRSDAIPIPDELINETIEDVDPGEVHIQEERRLAYVGATRAKQILYLTAASLYSGGVRKKKPSLFLNEILNRKISDEDFDTAASAKGSNGNGSSKQAEFAIHVSTNDDSLDVKDLKLDIGEWVSYSQLSMYERCPKQYKYGYVLGLPRPSSPALSFGISVHSALNLFYKRLIDSKSGLEGFNDVPTLDDLHAFYQSGWVSAGYDGAKHEKLRYQFGKDMLEKYYNSMFSEEESPIALENSFKLKIDESTVNGKIDRIDLVSEKDGVKTVNLIDYKTGKAKKEKDVKKDMQLAIYALAAEESLGLKVNTVGLWFVEHGEKVEFEVTEKMKLDAKVKIREIVADMKKREFMAKPNMFSCRFCDFSEICADSEA
jgi:DNA helicase II / ATP-dependent DNA helicase PcrA